jgi:hypothetical protein
MRLEIEHYQKQSKQWPLEGRHILAQFTTDTIVVYQAFRSEIGYFAYQYGYFGGEFSFSRMSWIKPNFLWMMYRCGWATKPEQNVVLAITLKRTAFNEVLEQAVSSTFDPKLYGTQEAWQLALKQSEVRLQWDPDHDPLGQPLKRKAIQLGLRGRVLKKYAKDWIVSIEDITDFVREQHQAVEAGTLETLITPLERVYETSEIGKQRIGLL